VSVNDMNRSVKILRLFMLDGAADRTLSYRETSPVPATSRCRDRSVSSRIDRSACPPR
jgi:hypothetical protein